MSIVMDIDMHIFTSPESFRLISRHDDNATRHNLQLILQASLMYTRKITFLTVAFLLFRFLINWRSCSKQQRHTRRSYQSFFLKTRGPFSFQFIVSSGITMVMRIWITSPIKKATTTRPVKQKGITVISTFMLILGCTNK